MPEGHPREMALLAWDLEKLSIIIATNCMTANHFAPRFEVSIHTGIIGKSQDSIRAEGWERKSRTAKELLEELAIKGVAVLLWPLIAQGDLRTSSSPPRW